MRPFSFPLFVPADRPDRFSKAAAAGTDVIIVDLEDAVNAASKVEAREMVRGALAELEGPDVWLRVNGAATPWHEEDVALAASSGVKGVLLPKAECPDQLSRLRASLPAGQAVIGLVESARGIRACYEVAEACDRLVFGSLDFALDLDCQPSRDACLMARSTIVAASRAARIAAPLDGVTTRINDEALIRDDAAYASGLGFGGKVLIHPKQIASARAGFAPSPDDAEWARKVLSGGDGGEARSVDGEMVDAPMVERARLILARSEALE